MRVAVTSKGTDLDSPVDPRFGRAAYILIVDTFGMGVQVIDNSENVNAFKRAGIQAASLISNKNVVALMTGFCGPNAFKTLGAAGVKVIGDISGTVREAVVAFIEGRVSYAEKENTGGYW